jgi:ATP-binding cassette subfamily C protein
MLAWSLLQAIPTLVSGVLIGRAVDDGFLSGHAGTGLVLLGCYAVTMVVGAAASRRAIQPMARMVEALRDDLIRDVVTGGLARAMDRPGESCARDLARITEQAERVRQLVSNLVMSALTAGSAAVAALAGLFFVTPIIGLILVPVLAAASMVLVWLSRVWRMRYEQSLEAEEEMVNTAGRLYRGTRDVFACAASTRAQHDLVRKVDVSAAADVAVANIGGARIGVIGATARIPLLALLFVGPTLLANGALSVGELIAAATYLITGLEPAINVLFRLVGNTGIELGVILCRLNRFRASDSIARADGATVNRFDLTLSSVTFRYGPYSTPVLDAANLTVAHGEHLVVVGPSGIGKSTLAAVLAGFESPEAGRIELGGVDIDTLDPAWMRRTVVLVPQESFVFAGSLRENLTYLAPSATDADLNHAVYELGLDRTVAALGGYDAPVGGLSLGERQLITAVRVYLSDAEIVILDEATCHLDPVAESRVERAFINRLGTVIVIAHRISSAINADRVLVLDGRTVHSGTHEELIERLPRYAELVGAWRGEPELMDRQ